MRHHHFAFLLGFYVVLNFSIAANVINTMKYKTLDNWNCELSLLYFVPYPLPPYISFWPFHQGSRRLFMFNCHRNLKLSIMGKYASPWHILNKYDM